MNIKIIITFTKKTIMGNKSETMKTVFLKEVFTDEWVIESVDEILDGVLKIEAKRKRLLDDQFNRFSETCSKLYADKVCRELKGCSINSFIKNKV